MFACAFSCFMLYFYLYFVFMLSCAVRSKLIVMVDVVKLALVPYEICKRK